MPNTCSTPSALRHSMIASTARMRASSFPAVQGLARSSRARSIQCKDLFRKLQVLSTAHADLVVDRHDRPAVLTAPQRLVLLPAPQERGDGPQERQAEADQEPDEE